MKRKGQAQVIETILLVMITVALWTIVWMWFYPTYTGVVQNMGNQLTSLEMSSKEWITIEYSNCSGTNISIFLINSGDVEVDVGSIYINNTLIWSGIENLKVGENKKLSATGCPADWKMLEIKVCSIRGNCWKGVEYAWP